MTGRWHLSLGALLSTWLLCGGAAAAQTSPGRIVMTVKDQSGALVPGADITLDASPAVERRAGADGTVDFPALRPGVYQVTVTAPGFVRLELSGVRVAAGETTAATATLRPGGPRETVRVTAADVTPGVATVGHMFDGRSLTAQPSSERDILTFATQAAGVAPPAPGSRLSTQGNTAINSSGAREAANNFLLDGLDNNDLFLNRLVVNPSLDAVASVTLRQNTYDAAYGRSAGAHLDVVLKSGTSVMSGTAYEFFRRSPRNLFGATVGGPLGRSGRAFFFVAGEGVDAHERETRFGHVPTRLERSGDFSASGTPVTDPVTGRPFPDARIPASRISPASAAIAALYPMPNQPDAAANFSATPDAVRQGGNATAKTDITLGGGLLSIRYSFSSDTRKLPFVARNRNLPGFGVDDIDRGQSAAAAWNTPIGARIVNTLAGNITRLRRDNLPGGDPASPTYAVSGFETIGDDPNLPVVRRTRSVDLTDKLIIERGRHTITTGAELRTYASDGYNHLFDRGKVIYTGAFTGNAFADLLLGLPTVSLLADNDNRQALRTFAINAFAQTEWRPTSRVAVNAGLRYEVAAPPYDRDNRMRTFDVGAARLIDVGTSGVPRGGVHADLNNLAPRIAVSWDPTGRATTVVRAGYGVFYDSGTLIENSALYFNPPYYTLTVNGFTPAPPVNFVDPQFRSAYAHQVSVSVERHGVSARYVGAFGRNLVRKRNLNQPLPGPGPLDPRRPITGFSDILIVESAARSTYHGLQISADRPWRNGLEAHVAYTLSRSMDDASAFLASDGNDNTPQDSRTLAGEWGPSDFDVRHRFVASLTWLTASTLNAPWRNWQAGAVFTAQSGRPYTPRLSIDNSNTGNNGGATFASDRPDLADGRFVIPPKFTFGNAGRNILTGPGYASLDISLSRLIPAGGHRVFEARLEVFNALDRRNGQLPDSFVDRSTFGQVLAWYPPRQWQVAGRLRW